MTYQKRETGPAPSIRADSPFVQDGLERAEAGGHHEQEAQPDVHGTTRSWPGRVVEPVDARQTDRLEEVVQVAEVGVEDPAPERIAIVPGIAQGMIRSMR